MRYFFALLPFVIPLSAAAEPATQVFEVPAGAHPHDVAPAPDGKVWYTAQQQGALGILDPATGEVRQVPLGDGSAPHGVIAGPDGAAWITDGGQNAIVRVDPATDKVTSWPLPENADDANLNTAAFDGDGNLWFTGQSGYYGKLDPKTGVITAFEAPEGRGPYGIDATPDGEVWFSSLAGSYIAHRPRDRQARCRTDARRGRWRAPRLVRQQGRSLGQLVERGQARALQTRRRYLEDLAASRGYAARLCRLCGRP
jgi:virginiamycin B lyase